MGLTVVDHTRTAWGDPAVGHVSQKTDTYAFGVVLLELLTGKPPFDAAAKTVLAFEMAPMMAAPEARLPPVLDRRAGGGRDVWPRDGALELARIAAWCLKRQASERCTIRDVLYRIDFVAGREPGPSYA